MKAKPEFIIPKLLKYCTDITVVDGNSNDNTKNVSEKFKVKYVKDNNLGKGDAQRVGAALSSKKFLIFLMQMVLMRKLTYQSYMKKLMRKILI